jgi:hypothetical protein
MKTLFDLIPEKDFKFLENEKSEKFYLTYFLKKKSGKKRKICAPQDPLKTLQTQIKEVLLNSIPAHPAAVGFVKGKNVKTGALEHLGAKVLYTLDLEDFFTSIRGRKVRRLISYIKHYAISNLNINITEEQSELLFKVFTFQGSLPQGSPCSPDLANIYCYGLDQALQVFSTSRHLTYTRYADDLTFSHQSSAFSFTKNDLLEIESIIKSHELKMNYNKCRILRRHKRMDVTGIVINEKISLQHSKVKKLRAEIHNAWKNNFQLSQKQKEILSGKVNWIQEIAPHKLHLLNTEKLNKILKSSGKQKLKKQKTS